MYLIIRLHSIGYKGSNLVTCVVHGKGWIYTGDFFSFFTQCNYESPNLKIILGDRINWNIVFYSVYI